MSRLAIVSTWELSGPGASREAREGKQYRVENEQFSNASRALIGQRVHVYIILDINGEPDPNNLAVPDSLLNSLPAAPAGSGDMLVDETVYR